MRSLSSPVACSLDAATASQLGNWLRQSVQACCSWRAASATAPSLISTVVVGAPVVAGDAAVVVDAPVVDGSEAGAEVSSVGGAEGAAEVADGPVDSVDAAASSSSS